MGRSKGKRKGIDSPLEPRDDNSVFDHGGEDVTGNETGCLYISCLEGGRDTRRIRGVGGEGDVWGVEGEGGD